MKSDSRITMQLVATLTKSFMSSFKTAGDTVKDFEKKVKKLDDALDISNKMKKMETASKALGNSIKKTEEKLNKLQQEAAKTGDAYGTLTQAINKQKAKLEEYRNKQKAVNDQVAQASNKLRTYGVEAKSAAEAQQKLNAKIAEEKRLLDQQRQHDFKKRVASGAKGVGRGMVAGGFMSFGAGLGTLYTMHNFMKKSMHVERQLGLMKAISADDKSFDLKTAETNIRDVALKTGLTMDTLADLSVELAKAGIDLSKQVGPRGMLKTMADMSLATGESPETAMKVLSQIQATFSKSLSKDKTLRATGYDTRDALNMVVQAANDSIISVSDINESMKYVASTMSMMGVSLPESLAMITQIGKGNLRGGQATRSFKSAMLGFASPTKKATDTIADFKKETGFDFDVWTETGNFKGLDYMVERLTTLNELVSPKSYLDFVSNVFQKEAAVAIMQLTKDGAKGLSDLRTEISRLQNAAKEDVIGASAVNQLNTVSGAMDLLKTQFDELAAVMFFDLGGKEILKQTLTDMRGLVGVITDITKANKGMVQGIIGAVPWLGTLGVALGALAMVSGSVLSTIGDVGLGVLAFQRIFPVASAAIATFASGAIGWFSKMAVAAWASLGPYGLLALAGNAAIGYGAYKGYEAISDNISESKARRALEENGGWTADSVMNPEFKAQKERTSQDRNTMFATSISKAPIQNVNNGNNHVVINIEGSVDQGVMGDLKNLFKTPGVTPAMPAFIGAGSAFKSKDGFN